MTGRVTLAGRSSIPTTDLDAMFTELYAGVTVADGAVAQRWKAATGNLAVRPYVDATYGVEADALNASFSAFIPLTLGGSPFRILTNAGLAFVVESGGAARPGSDNAFSLGTSSYRWSTVYAATGTINTSDAREKTSVQPLTANEIAAAKQLAGELGSFRFLEAVAAKGDGARLHIGMTVQRAMDILVANGLDPLHYAFICHDSWAAEHVPARTELRPTGMLDDNGQALMKAVEVEPAHTIPAGDRYGFRTDELLMFLARGFDARLQALESHA